jgi:hypothetical protein
MSNPVALVYRGSYDASVSPTVEQDQILKGRVQRIVTTMQRISAEKPKIVNPIKGRFENDGQPFEILYYPS